MINTQAYSVQTSTKQVRQGSVAMQTGLNSLREAVAPVLQQAQTVVVTTRAGFGNGPMDDTPAGSIGAFLGDTRYYQEARDGRLMRNSIPPRTIEEAQANNVEPRRLNNDNQRLQRVRRTMDDLRRADNGRYDQNPKPGVVVESGTYGRSDGRGPQTPYTRFLTYNNETGSAIYESRLGAPGSSEVEFYQQERGQFLYRSGQQGQTPDRVIETLRGGVVRSTRRPGLGD